MKPSRQHERFVGARHAAPLLGTPVTRRACLAFGVSLFVIALAAPCVLDDCKCHRPAAGETTRQGANLFVVQDEEKPYRDLNGIVEMGSAEPVGDVLVEIFDQPEYLLKAPAKAPKQKRLAACVTGADGKFCFRYLPAGEYELRASLNGGVNITHVYVVVEKKAGKRERLHVKMSVGT
ncbi:MAG: carboxypeptidase-like regulatory domain-containing protein [Candidatus Acidiferrales bacterium]